MTRYKWIVEEVDPSLKRQIVERFHTTPAISEIILKRNLADSQTLRNFISCPISELNDPFLLPAMAQAVGKVLDVVQNKKKIVVYGDYDVDGITSTSLLVEFLRKLDAQVGFYVPNRFDEGYGLNEEAVVKLAGKGYSLLIAVDCGTNSLSVLAKAREYGIEVVVCDHHNPLVSPDKGTIIVNPKLPDSRYPYPELAGVGVVFKLISALLSGLKDSQRSRFPSNFLTQTLDLVALGTICDVAPLTGENRILVKRGLSLLVRTRRPGLVALKKVAGLEDKKIGTYEVGFLLGPRLNAAGRMSSALECVQLLLEQNHQRAHKISQRLDEENRKRQKIQEEIALEIDQLLETEESLEKECGLVLFSADWHEGVLGIVASRVAKMHRKPTVLLTRAGDMYKGSARSIESFDLFQALSGCQHLLDGFGGHRLAAGLRMRQENLLSFREKFVSLANQVLLEEDRVAKLHVDSPLTAGDMKRELFKFLKYLEPYGEGNQEPIFLFKGALLTEIRPTSDLKHLKLRVKVDSLTFQAVMFNAPSEILQQIEVGSQIDLVFCFRESDFDTYGGYEIVVLDLRLNNRADCATFRC